MAKTYRFLVLTGSAGLTLYSASASAAGVDAGTLIENTATATYASAGTPRTIDSNTVTVLVDEILDVTVSSNDAAAHPVAGTATLSFRVTNQGNGPEAFTLTAEPSVTGNDFDVTIAGIALDSNGNGVYDQGIDTLLPNGSTGSILGADNGELVFVIVNAPAGIVDGANSQVRLRADASTGTSAPGTVFANRGVNNGDAVVGATSASADALGSLVASVAGVTLTKSATILDPFGGTQAVPGSIVTFRIVAAVAGSGSIDNLNVSDNIPVGTTYSPGTLALNGTALTDAADSDAGSFTGSAISVSAGTVPAGGNRTITFNVTIDRD